MTVMPIHCGSGGRSRCSLLTRSIWVAFSADGAGVGQYRRTPKGTHAMTTQAMSIIHDVMASEAYRASIATLTADHHRTVEDIVTLTQVAAPPFQEETRANAFLAMANAHGLKKLESDTEGNVTGIRPGVGGGPRSASLPTSIRSSPPAST